MRPLLPLLLGSVVSVTVYSAVGCGSSSDTPPIGDDGGAFDAPAHDATGVDAEGGADATNDTGDGAPSDAADADADTCVTTLLVGGADIAAQGWLTASAAPDTVTYGSDYVRLETSTPDSGGAGGQLLIYKPNVFEDGKPFKIQVVMLVESVKNHNQFDSAAAIMGSFTPSAGNATDRSEMIYLDNAAIGWADDTQSFATTITNNTYHTYQLSVDASKTALVSVDGVAALTRANFTTNGTLALGDQTNDPGFDGVVRIRSVTKLCP